MLQRKVVKKAKRLVWRMSPTNPAGAFVAPCRRHAKGVDPAEVHERGFRASSLELSNGNDVVETEMNTLPGT